MMMLIPFIALTTTTVITLLVLPLIQLSLVLYALHCSPTTRVTIDSDALVTTTCAYMSHYTDTQIYSPSSFRYALATDKMSHRCRLIGCTTGTRPFVWTASPLLPSSSRVLCLLSVVSALVCVGPES